ncbi:CMA1 Chymase, partial [Crotophaga sulcirostris]|nr:CMA1 Chymase [Crotophaga sulcirostris]
YLAYLQGEDNSFCGGFLVAPNWVMTAAQCLAYKPLTVILGARTIQKREESWQTFEVLEYYRHPDYTSPKKGKDILLLKLKGNATSNDYVGTISFEKSKVPSRTKCSIAGWGHKTPDGALRESAVTIIDSRDCLNLYPGLADNLVCGLSKSAGVPEKVSSVIFFLGPHRNQHRPLSPPSPSQSDAGDPLVCNNKAYGIFSYRHSNWPGFYTRIAPYLPWVESVMR